MAEQDSLLTSYEDENDINKIEYNADESEEEEDSECMFCLNMKSATEYPPLSASCHRWEMPCKVCFAVYIRGQPWGILRCPCGCGREIPYNTVKECMDVKMFARYMEFMNTWRLHHLDDFHWCAAETCDHGQIFESKTKDSTFMQCHKCGRRTCIKCKALHEDLTCEEHKKLKGTSVSDKNLQLTEKVISTTSNQCPKCHRDIEKVEGCGMIYCTCGTEFVWVDPRFKKGTTVGKILE